MSKTKEIAKGLNLKKGDDGHWLHFESHGMHGSLNLENLMDGRRIIAAAVLGWAGDQFEDKAGEEAGRVKEVVDFPVRYDDLGQMVFDSEEHLICDIRGWGRLKYTEDAEKTQDEIGQFIVDAMNEKAKRDFG